MNDAPRDTVNRGAVVGTPPPVATTPEEVATIIGKGKLITADIVDVDGDVMSVELPTEAAKLPANGDLEPDAASGGFKYTPKKDFVGTDTFSYTVVDGNNGTLELQASVTVSEWRAQRPCARARSRHER